MPTVIDSFVVELGLDPKKFTEGQKAALASFKQTQQEALSQAKQVEDAGKRMTNYLSNFKREAIGAFALFFGGKGFKEIIVDTVNFNAAIGRTARTLDMSTKELSAWGGVAHDTGSSVEEMTGAMQGLTDKVNIAQITGDYGDLAGIFNQLSVKLFDSNGQTRKASDYMLDLAGSFKTMDPARARALMLSLGIPTGVINTLLIGRDTIEELLDQQKNLRPVTEANAAAATDLQKQWYQASDAAMGFANNLLTFVEPALSAVLKLVKTFFTSMNDAPNMPTDVAAAATGEIGVFSDAGSNSGPDLGGFHSGRVDSALGLTNQTPSSNWTNFLSGLSYLKTSQKGGGNDSSSAQGYFQFLNGTAGRATRAGLPDPRKGSWNDQASATMAYIRKFYPAAAAAIDAGNFSEASSMLKGEWPSLPGGIQPQSAARYRTWAQELQGGGPRPFGAAAAAASSTHNAGDVDNSKTNHFHEVNINSPKVDADSISNLSESTERAGTASDFNFAIGG